MPDPVLPKAPSPAPDASAISQEMIEQAIRQRYSPFPELTMAVLTMQLNQFRTGDLRNAARTWEIMFERDGELSGPALQRYADAARLPWEIIQDEESAEADEHARCLEYFYNNLTARNVLDQEESGGANVLFRQMMTAKAYRYSVHEMVLRVDSAGAREVTAQFNHCPVYFFESRRGRLAYLRNLGDYHGTFLERGRWLPAVGEGLMRQCCISYFIKHRPLADWLLYASRFGLPGIHGKTDAAKDSPEWNAFVESLKHFANDWITATNRGAEISLVEASKGGSGTLPFQELIERCDRLYARLWRGGDLSTKSREGNDVSGASLQGDEKRILLEDDGQWLTDTLNTHVDEPVIEYLFGTRPKAWICVRPPKQVDSTKQIESLRAAREMKIPVSIETARERLQLPAPQDDDELIAEAEPPQPAAQPGFQQRALANNQDQARLAKSIATDIQPVLQALESGLQQIFTIADPKLRLQKWQELWNATEQLRKDVAAYPETALVLQQLYSRAFAAGLTRKETAS